MTLLSKRKKFLLWLWVVNLAGAVLCGLIFLSSKDNRFLAISSSAYVGLIFLLLTLLPNNLLRLHRWEHWGIKWPMADYRQQFGLLSFGWFWVHFTLAVTYLRSRLDIGEIRHSQIDYALDTGQISIFVFVLLFITSNRWSQKVLGGNWNRLHSLVWVTIPLILMHAVSARWWFVKEPAFSAIAPASLIVFALYEFSLFKQLNITTDRFRHIVLIGVGMVYAVYFTFFFRNETWYLTPVASQIIKKGIPALFLALVIVPIAKHFCQYYKQRTQGIGRQLKRE
jgi:DMSO/TMAO reductase YedYZ heme-binding membrane subunit